MDFITLAAQQHRLLRRLDEMLGDDDEAVEDAAAASLPSLEQQTQWALSYPDAAAATPSAATTTTTTTRPLLSPAAEAELYLLATNFLLYVAMVIVVIIVCRVYFPESLRSRPRIPRRYDYRVAAAVEDDEEPVGSSEGEEVEEDDDESDLDEVLDSGDEGDDLMEPLTHPKGGPSNVLEFEQESLSKRQVLQRLVLCCVMLNVTFVMWGALQVRSRRR
jgi:hypothetical protein